MTNNLVGDVYQKIIEEVVAASANDFEESAVPQSTLNELRQAWQAKLSARGVAQMTWDPKPEPAPRVQNNGNIPSSSAASAPSYQSYADETSLSNGARVKLEPTDQSYGSQPGNYAPVGPQQGGIARAQELVQERFGQQAAAAIQRPGGLTLPGQQPKPQGLQLPGQTQQQAQQQYAQQQHQMMARQQAALQQQQMNPRIKVEDSPNASQGQFAPQQQRMPPAYAQTDGADDLAAWRADLARRRAVPTDQIQRNDRMMRDQITALSKELESGLMLPFEQSRAGKRRIVVQPSASNAIPQLDGDADNEDSKPSRADEDDDDAINSDLDDPDDDQNPIGDDEDELGDTILATYDKVQRVKNKWKCTLKDGVLNTGGKEWLFHKGQGEFEW